MRDRRGFRRERPTRRIAVDGHAAGVPFRSGSPNSLLLHAQALQLAEQIEIWFAVLRSKLTRYGSFHSLTDLQDRIVRFIAYYNTHLAHPFRWTCDGRLLCK